MSGKELQALTAGLDGSLSGDGGYGMYNVQQRLQLVYGSSAGMSFERPPEGGFRIGLRIPYPVETEERTDDPRAGR
jgi:two-component system sensor histidine kinase YesM